VRVIVLEAIQLWQRNVPRDGPPLRRHLPLNRVGQARPFKFALRKHELPRESVLQKAD
jgi:hypothetical protein